MDEKIVIYKTKNGPQMDVRLEQETVWLTQKQMSQLFGKDVRTINEHIGNVFKEGELKENSVIRKFRITAAALSLLIAISNPKEKDTMIKIITNLLKE